MSAITKNILSSAIKKTQNQNQTKNPTKEKETPSNKSVLKCGSYCRGNVSIYFVELFLLQEGKQTSYVSNQNKIVCSW